MYALLLPRAKGKTHWTTTTFLPLLLKELRGWG